MFGDDDDDDDEDEDDDSPVQSPAAAQQQVAQQAVAQQTAVEAADPAEPQGVSDNIDELANDVPNGESDLPKDPQQIALDQAATINNNIDPVDTGAVVDDEDGEYCAGDVDLIEKVHPFVVHCKNSLSLIFHLNSATIHHPLRFR